MHILSTIGTQIPRPKSARKRSAARFFRPFSALCRLACVALCLPCAAQANTIDVSLNVIYDVNTDPLSGGNWSLAVKTGGAGLNHLNLKLTGIATAIPVAPVGTVNGTDEAGFGFFGDASFPTYRNVTIGQAALSNVTGGREQSIFYGVGTLVKGSPEWPGKPNDPEIMTLGPAFSSLTNVFGVPWANMPDELGNSAWDNTAIVLRGTFNDGVTPAFSGTQSGSIFTSTGNSQTAGPLLFLPLTTAIVRTNLVSPADPDYNNDGVVNAADYVVWRNARITQNLVADGSGPTGFPDGVVDQFDYQFWKDNYGQTVPIGSGAAAPSENVPEPTTALLLVLAGFSLLGRARGGAWSRAALAA